MYPTKYFGAIIFNVKLEFIYFLLSFFLFILTLLSRISIIWEIINFISINSLLDMKCHTIALKMTRMLDQNEGLPTADKAVIAFIKAAASDSTEN